MNLLDLQETSHRLVKANGMRWYGHLLKRDNNDVLRRALDFEVFGREGRGRTKKMWRRQIAKQVEEIKQKQEDAIDRPK